MNTAPISKISAAVDELLANESKTSDLKSEFKSLELKMNEIKEAIQAQTEFMKENAERVATQKRLMWAFENAEHASFTYRCEELRYNNVTSTHLLKQALLAFQNGIGWPIPTKSYVAGVKPSAVQEGDQWVIYQGN
ncbi:hypothetical protein HDV05_004451 [Chytridiales sp. JEL 0842]|nr:hypothetical protein HDV05_004451 [Chytridiales sp. JEL 0842]